MRDGTTGDGNTPDPWARSAPPPDPVPGPAPTDTNPDPPTGPIALPASGRISRTPRPRTPWTVTDVLAGLGTTLLLSIVLAVPFTSADQRTGVTALVLAGLLPVRGGLLAAVLWACRAHGSGHLRSDLGLHVRWIHLASARCRAGLAALTLRTGRLGPAVVTHVVFTAPPSWPVC